MPYYVHKKTDTDRALITSALNMRFECIASARACVLNIYSEKTHKITFIATEAETEAWRERELSRFDTGDYLQTPWEMAGYNYYPEHYAHLSIKTPGMIAYTKSDEHGVLDRQTSIKPGRYLTQYYTDTLIRELGYNPIRKALLDDWIAQCSDAVLKIAKTCDDIERVYIGGPTSCMDGKHWQGGNGMQSSEHPTRLYGYPGSDLAVAYYGNIDHVSARCVVWPAKKRYTRVYGGAAVLLKLLHHAGYEKESIRGAKLPAVSDGDGWLMPYVDYIQYGSLSRDGKFIVIDGEGSIDLQETGGIAGEREREDEDEDESSASCDRCGHRYSYDNEGGDGYCQTCYDHRYVCRDCDAMHDDRDRERVEVTDEIALCQNCADRATLTCAIEGCDETWIERSLDEDLRDERKALGIDHLCVNHAPNYRHCRACAIDYLLTSEDDTTRDRCPDCGIASRCTQTTDLNFAYDCNAPMIGYVNYYDDRAHHRHGGIARCCRVDHDHTEDECCSFGLAYRAVHGIASYRPIPEHDQPRDRTIKYLPYPPPIDRAETPAELESVNA